MPINKYYLAKFSCGNYYHIYNRTNNKENLFKDDVDRMIFLKRLKAFSFGYFDVLAFCFLDNHFHLLVKIKSQKSIIKFIEDLQEQERTKCHKNLLESPTPHFIDFLVIDQLRRLFISYSVGFNKRHGRKGSLFQRPFKRICVKGVNDLRRLVLYIHFNPVKHLITPKVKMYEWSSYFEILMDAIYLTEYNELMKIFEDKTAFIKYHEKENDYTEIAKLLMEDNFEDSILLRTPSSLGSRLF